MSDTTDNRFAHQRLDAYRVALEMFRGVELLAGRLPRGFGNHKDQLRRAAAAVVRNIAEGANRTHPRDKASRFTIARGECGECDASLEMIEVLELLDPRDLRRLREQADRVAAMLRGLIRRETARASP
ncbi:MAG: four helix bundle protein [Planctomycetota bacterium]|nr:four helix bundle protein [Planctomycetota bacterium]